MKNIIRIAGVVLAGGKSSRFGSDKSQILIGDKPIVQLQLEKLGKAGCGPLFVVGRLPSVGDLITRTIEIHDLHPNLGPIGGLHAALVAAKDADAVFLLACDMPLISAKTLYEIAQSFEPRLDAVVPIHEGQIEPLCAVYSRKILPAVENCIAARKLAMHDLAKLLTTTFFDASTLANWEREFYNVNTPEDYEQIRREI